MTKPGKPSPSPTGSARPDSGPEARPELRPELRQDIQPGRDIAQLVAIMAALRTPRTGCPWDLEQDFASIAPYTIEEAYEVADAIQRGDLDDLRDELGDLLLQVVYHARMAEEGGHFNLGDVVLSSTEKMIRRHPHVFGDVDINDADAVAEIWGRIKAEERAEKASRVASRQAAGAAADASAVASLLASVPLALPAMTRAIKLQDKAAAVGFDWPHIAPVFNKLREEITELETEISALATDAPSGADTRSASTAAIRDEFGDMLFVMANMARHLKIDPEDAVRAANAKFTRRFAYIEQRLAERGKTPAQSDLAEMDTLWDEVRAADKA